MNPRIVVTGEGAEDYVGHALALYKRFETSGRQRQTFALDNCIILLEIGSIKIIVLVAEYALFAFNPATASFRSAFPEVVPQEWPELSQLLPSMPTMYPVYPDELMVPLYDRCDTYGAGAAAPYQTVMFADPILSEHGEYLLWQGLTMQPNLDTENQMILLRYQLGGYLNVYDQPMHSKILLVKDAAGLFEADFSALNVFPASRLARPGVAYRRLKGQERIVACIQDDATYSGQVYEVLEVDGALGLSPFGLPDLPAGGRYAAGIGPAYTDTGTNGRHVDWMYDIFTSERSLHYYVVAFCSDSAVTRNIASGNPYPNDIQLFAGMSLTVEKRLKSDLSLVDTYTLTPSAVDTSHEGITAAQIFWNAANGQADGYTTGQADLTRLIPYGTGFVLVDAAGVEYPLLPVLVCTQKLFGAPLSARNVMQQTALLWLGTPPEGFDGYDWGVEATGLKISEAQPGLSNDTGFGLFRIFGGSIGDSDRVMIPAQPFDSQLAFLQPFTTTATVMTLECRYFYSGFTAGDKVHIDTDDGPFSYTVTSDDLTGSDAEKQENIVASAIAAFNAQATNYEAAWLTSGSDGAGYYTRFTVTRLSDGELSVAASFALFTQGQSNRQRVLSVRADGTPIVRLEKILPTSQALSMFDI